MDLTEAEEQLRQVRSILDGDGNTSDAVAAAKLAARLIQSLLRQLDEMRSMPLTTLRGETSRVVDLVRDLGALPTEGLPAAALALRARALRQLGLPLDGAEACAAHGRVAEQPEPPLPRRLEALAAEWETLANEMRVQREDEVPAAAARSVAFASCALALREELGLPVPAPPPSVREQVNLIAEALARAEGWKVPRGTDFTTATDPRSVRWCGLAEAAYEALTGDRPEYEELL